MWYLPDSFISDVMGMGTVKVKMLGWCREYLGWCGKVGWCYILWLVWYISQSYRTVEYPWTTRIPRAISVPYQAELSK